jgi:hypothetical protein
MKIARESCGKSIGNHVFFFTEIERGNHGCNPSKMP